MTFMSFMVDRVGPSCTMKIMKSVKKGEPGDLQGPALCCPDVLLGTPDRKILLSGISVSAWEPNPDYSP